MLLAGDIGGTKTALALVDAARGVRAPVAQSTFPSAEYGSLEALAAEFLAQARRQQGNLAVDRACFGVSGPVVDGQATITNLPWVMSESTLQEALNLKAVHLLNDLESIASAVPILEPEMLHTLSPGRAKPGGSIAVIAPGTGLGEAYLTWDGSGYRAHACEGGHTDFAPTNAFEMGLLNYLLREFEHVSYERVCSGKGLPNLYHYIKSCELFGEPEWLAAEIGEADDIVPVIIGAAMEGKPGSEICVATLNLFVSILGAEAGNLALKLGAMGGVYLGGGIPPRILPALASGRFMQSFREKGRLGSMLTHIPVQVILESNAGLLGAAHYGLHLMGYNN
jgi:glucokinase